VVKKNTFSTILSLQHCEHARNKRPDNPNDNTLGKTCYKIRVWCCTFAFLYLSHFISVNSRRYTLEYLGRTDHVDSGRTISGDRDFPVSFPLIHSLGETVSTANDCATDCGDLLLWQITVSIVLRVFVFVISDFT